MFLYVLHDRPKVIGRYTWSVLILPVLKTSDIPDVDSDVRTRWDHTRDQWFSVFSINFSLSSQSTSFPTLYI